jgi:hypothetical protein
MQAAVEAEVERFLGRARYQRPTEVPEGRAGSGYGYCPTKAKNTRVLPGPARRVATQSQRDEVVTPHEV